MAPTIPKAPVQMSKRFEEQFKHRPSQITTANIQEISALLTELKLKQKDDITPMSVESFLNPVQELIVDEVVSNDDLIDSVVDRHNSIEEEEEEEEEMVVEPERPSIQKALECLRVARLYEMYCEQSDQQLICNLDMHESVLFSRMNAALRQPTIDSFFTSSRTTP
ncbi:hypothetical protein E4U59_006470 [Claviceps monticola]|nr:hypothetical protein E4U59_006470 [Claviceps monticola]